MSRKTTLAAGALAALLAGGLSVGVASAAPDRDCPSFTYQEDAQEYFESIGGSADNNADLLDDNGDGVACENRPKRGSGATTPNSPAPAPDNEDESSDEPSNESSDEPAPTDDDDSTADTSGSQVEVVPEGSADTGSA